MKTEPWVYGNWLGIAGTVLAIPVAIARHVGALESPRWDYYNLAALAAWAIGPPLWFAWERDWHVKHGATTERLAELKANQETARSIWAGVLAFLALLYLKHAGVVPK